MPDESPCLESLAAQAHKEGGWGYSPGQAPHLEPTCLALLALDHRKERFADAWDSGWSLIRRARQRDGSYRLPGDREEAIWTTSQVLYAFQATGQEAEEARTTIDRLLSWEGRKPDSDQAREIHDINLALTGWPWAVNNFSWVEPTAWACLALRRAGLDEHPRVEEGQKLLLDRAFDDGGVNYGNRMVLGRKTEPIVGPTALMLLTLQGREQGPRVAGAVRYLLEQVRSTEDVEHLSWARLALDCFAEFPSVRESLTLIEKRIHQAYEDRSKVQWLRPSATRDALAVLALTAGTRNLFKLPTERPSQQIPSAENECAVARISRHEGTWRQRIAAKFRGLAVEAMGKLRSAPCEAAVHIAPVRDYNDDLAGILSRQYTHFRESTPLSGKRVVLKPNLVEYHREKVINTHPNVVAAAIEFCLREGASEVIVAEGPGHWRNVEYLVQASGLGDVLRHHKVVFVDLNHDEPIKCLNLGRLTGLESLYLSRTIVEAEVLISIPKLKTHHWAGATLSLKNLFGTLPGICYGWPKNELHWRGIDNSIVDIALTRTPDLAIVDAIVGMEGDGPLNGTARPLGALIMGNDLVAVDATCCRLMQLTPEGIGYLALAQHKRLGTLQEAQIRQFGERIDTLAQPFDTIAHFRGLQLRKSA